MKNAMLVVMLAAAPVAGQEFASTAPAVNDILVKTRAFHASSAEDADRRSKLLGDLKETRDNIKKYGDDSTRAGIYKAELSLSYLKLALEEAREAGASEVRPNAAATAAQREENRAGLLAEISKMKEKAGTYGQDPLRAGIYMAELGLLQARLALMDVSDSR